MDQCVRDPNDKHKNCNKYILYQESGRRALANVCSRKCWRKHLTWGSCHVGELEMEIELGTRTLIQSSKKHESRTHIRSWTCRKRVCDQKYTILGPKTRAVPGN